LSAKTPEETNSISEPEKIVPVETSLKNVSADFHHTLPPYSIHVLELHWK
jgi:alpha-N-arabinofuranosidase